MTATLGTVLEIPCTVLALLFCRIDCAFNSVNQIWIKSRDSYCFALITCSQGADMPMVNLLNCCFFEKQDERGSRGQLGCCVSYRVPGLASCCSHRTRCYERVKHQEEHLSPGLTCFYVHMSGAIASYVEGILAQRSLCFHPESLSGRGHAGRFPWDSGRGLRSTRPHPRTHHFCTHLTEMQRTIMASKENVLRKARVHHKGSLKE